MDSTHPTAGWEKVGDRFYRKIQLYTAVFDLDLDLDNFFVAGAPYGGAVGVFVRPLLPPLEAWLHGAYFREPCSASRRPTACHTSRMI